MKSKSNKRDKQKYYEYHKDYGQEMTNVTSWEKTHRHQFEKVTFGIISQSRTREDEETKDSTEKE